MFPPLVRFARDVSGAVAPLFAVGLIAFVGVGALAWDISRGYALRAELEAAVDAAALAGATQLDGKAGAITRATAAAQGALVQNSSRLADTYQVNTVGAGDTIQFLTDLTGARTGTPDATGTALTATDSKANFIEITLAPRPMGLVLGGLLGVTSFNARAHAVAGYGTAICKVPPLFVCNPDEDQTIDLFGAHAGKGIIMNGAPPNQQGNQATFTPGNFGYLQVDGPNGSNLNALRDALGRSPPLTECYGDSVETRTGDPTTVLTWFNTRFDIYNFGGPTLTEMRSSPYFAPAEVTVTGLNDNSSGSHDICKPGAPSTVYSGAGIAGVTAMAMPMDTCAYPSGGQTCTGGVNALGTGTWDKASYFEVTHGYTGAISNTTAPVTGEQWADLYDYPGSSPKPTYPTRYQVYLWEKLHKDNPAIWDSFAAANTKTTETGDWATRQCSTATPVAGVPDRRTISVIVLNCSQIGNGASGGAQPVIGAADVFLTEPARINGNGAIIGEIISSTSDTSAVGTETRFYSVRLYE